MPPAPVGPNRGLWPTGSGCGRRQAPPVSIHQGEVAVLDTTWYLDLNRLARHTAWAHRAVAGYVGSLLSPVGGALLALAGVVVLGWLSARRSRPDQVATVVWAAVGGMVALGLDVVLAQVLATQRPYQALSGVEVLVPRSTSLGAMPNSHAALAGGVVAGLYLARRWWLGTLALVLALLLGLGLVYVGADYPSDALAGLAFGAVCEVVLWPLGAWLIVPLVESLASGPLAFTVASRAALPAAQRAGRRRAHPLAVGQADGLPSARAMEALRAATEAARHVPGGAGTAAPGPHPGNVRLRRPGGTDQGAP